uniref:Uncharacterized protein n=1 Tax=Pipistrellus kuhlii TaxID=59472 RepID=A0A7J7XCL5_PIPKU|nr:hypothetical protein mPipKuh1_015938 [Pipistrellus kuhlii]
MRSHHPNEDGPIPTLCMSKSLASLHHSHRDAGSCSRRRTKDSREPSYGAQGMAWMEGSRTGGSRLSSQMLSVFFRSGKTRCRLSPISPGRCEEGCMRTGEWEEVCSPLAPSLKTTDTAASHGHPMAATLILRQASRHGRDSQCASRLHAAEVSIDRGGLGPGLVEQVPLPIHMCRLPVRLLLLQELHTEEQEAVSSLPGHTHPTALPQRARASQPGSHPWPLPQTDRRTGAEEEFSKDRGLKAEGLPGLTLLHQPRTPKLLDFPSNWVRTGQREYGLQQWLA